ncbi:hypothetical protein ASA1KI_30640 [Opitutales bacterium ASA1]|uniref:carbohydrate ABC transporter permease n=1 Tax=Congregicoccus parvus TaxID=3081749 RepID=UPI002B29184A|nr:hypothetical protein ASA1KI_30640 [Opitutales bacterium ASA1]
MRAFSRLIVYALLFGGACLFVLPFVWMVATSLKPLHQTLSQPPTWIPRKHEALVAGEWREVVPGDLVTIGSVWVSPAGQDRPIALPRDDVRDGVWEPAPGRRIEVEVLRDVPATTASPWRVVRTLEERTLEVVPDTSIRTSIDLRWENYPKAIAAMGDFPRYLGNTILLCVLNVVGTVLSSALVAYGFSRIEWRWRDRLFGVLLATMMIPFPVVMVPLYSLFRWLGWVGTLKPLWVGAFFAGAFNVFLLRQFFRTIPKELSEAARIDGCGEFRIFWQIILPLCRPALVVVALFTFLGTWNDFLGPLVYLTDQKDFTLALGLQAMQSSRSGGTEWHYLMAAGTLIVLPVVLLFVTAQRSFVEGIALTGGKS